MSYKDMLDNVKMTKKEIINQKFNFIRTLSNSLDFENLDPESFKLIFLSFTNLEDRIAMTVFKQQDDLPAFKEERLENS